MQRVSSDARVTNVTFYVTVDGEPVPASTASVTINKLSPNAISAIIAYPVVSRYVRPVHGSQLTQPEEFEEGVGVLFVVAIVLPSILLILLLVVLSTVLLRTCGASSSADSAEAVPTKYQRGESLDDYNLHVDVERGEIVDMTPHPTPDPNFHRLSKSKSGPGLPQFAPFASGKEDTLDSKRDMIDKWLQGGYTRPRGSMESTESIQARSDTFLYRKRLPRTPKYNAGRDGDRDKDGNRPKHLEVPQEPYKEYLQALKLPESDIGGREGGQGGDRSTRSRESFAMEERNVDESPKRPSTPPGSREPPKAKPRASFLGKLRDSMRRRKRSATPEYNFHTQSTDLSALAGSAQTLPGSRDHDTSLDPDLSRDEDLQLTDAASDDFTDFVPMSRVSQDRLGSSSTIATSPVIINEPGQTDSLRQTPPGVAGTQNKDDARSREALGSEKSSSKRVTRKLISRATSAAPTSDRGVQTVTSMKNGTPLGDDWTLQLDASAVSSQKGSPTSGGDYSPSTRTMVTQTSFRSSSAGSDVQSEAGVKVKSVAVGRNTVNVRTQTSPWEKPASKAKRKSAGSERKHSTTSSSLPTASTEQLLQSDASMEDEQMEEELPPMKIEPFAKMSQILLQPPDKDATLPVKFRRNVLEESPGAPPEAEGVLKDSDVQAYHKPARHMRAQPRVSYSALDPEQRRQAELLDTAVERQQLLLRQQQETLAYARQQQLEQQAQQIVNKSLAVGTSSTPAAAANPQQHADHERLNMLLNEACVLAPHPGRAGAPVGRGWTPTQPPLNNQGYYNPITVLSGGMAGYAVPPPGAPGPFNAMGHDELMQAVRKELKRMQQE